MVDINDIINLIDDFMLEPDISFRELKAYLLNEFEWDTEPNKGTFMIRGLPIPDEKIVKDLIDSHMPNETIVFKEI